MTRLLTVSVFALQDEEANPAKEEDEEVWKDGDSGHQRLGKAQGQVLEKEEKLSTEVQLAL
ncbi:hypothetical protein HGM15179_021624, partial [Zosterops borbonicus]